MRASKPKGSEGANILYFGGQSARRDFIYRDELESFQSGGTLSQLHLAFSRDQPQKVYVQHLLQRQADADDLVAMLDQGTYFYVCGATSMGTDVLEAVVAVLQDKKKLSRTKAEALVQELQKAGKYVQELWTT